MDVNAAMESLEDLLDADDGGLDDMETLADDIRGWIAGGGFPPRWRDYPKATAYIQAD